jgi:putative toxin-antitoxin system antitoxin component (TIGR02293 family)
MSNSATKVKIRKSASAISIRRDALKASGIKTSVVDFCIHGSSGNSSIGQIKGISYPPSKIIESIKNGLSVNELAVLQASLDVPMERLAPKLGISRATLNRRMAEGRLEPGESDRLVRFAKLMGKAIEVFDTTENARRWLTSPQIGLGGALPLDYAETEVGAREVEDLLGRIEYGVYS